MRRARRTSLSRSRRKWKSDRFRGANFKFCPSTSNRGSFFKLNMTQSRYLPLVRKRKVCFASRLCKLLRTRQLSEIAVPLENI